MKLLILSLIICTAAFASSPNEEKKLLLRKTAEAIRVDAVIDAAWSSADSVSDFVQFQPYHGKEPTRRTVAKAIATDWALYVLVICFDDRENVQRNTGKLDDSSGDVVSLMIDTFGDKRTAYKFAVSASGVRSDARMLDDARNRDYSWDGIWFAAAKLYEWGFVVEMEIPFKSIQYDQSLPQWGLDFSRWIPAAREDIYWCRYEENEGQRISKFGALIFDGFRPSVKGLNLEVYPVGISRATYLRSNTYDVSPNAGIDIFYNPSRQLTFQLTANPDFAQIEADPFAFNISRYESYFEERRPFFTEGSEIFTASGRQRNTGFYRPLELFYSRRIGKKLPDGSEVPLLFGTKAFGRIAEWEYGGFLALTGEKDYNLNGTRMREDAAAFASARMKRQILDNSSVGVLFVGKRAGGNDYGVLDVDGAFRTSSWQLTYQLARSFENSQGDFAGSAGFILFGEKWINLARGRYIGKDFDVDQIGFVPWRGTWELTAITGPRWYYEQGWVRQMMIFFGFVLNNERVDDYTDRAGALGFNMQFRNNWGYEVSVVRGRAKELSREFDSFEVNFSSWFNISPKWDANFWGGYAKTYNFSRDYLAYYSRAGSWLSWQAASTVQLGTSVNVFIEGNPDNRIEEVTVNARPFFSITPVNDLNVRVYLDNVYTRSAGRVQRIIGGLLFSYNFLPKSWIYLALNEVRDRSPEYDDAGALLPQHLRVRDRAAVMKLKYLYYF